MSESVRESVQAMIERHREEEMMRLLARTMAPELAVAEARPGWRRSGAFLFLFNIPPFYATVVKTKHGQPWRWLIEHKARQPATLPFISFELPEGTATSVAAAQHAVENFVATLLHLSAYEGP